MKSIHVIAAFVLGGCAPLQPQLPASGGVQDVQQVPQLYIDAYRDGDARRIASLFSPDATFVPLLSMPRFQGRDAVQAYYQRAIASSKSRGITPTSQTLQDFGDVVVRTADIRIDQELLDGRKVVTPARVTFVYRRDRNGWLIVHHHQSVQPASPQPAPSSAASAASR